MTRFSRRMALRLLIAASAAAGGTAAAAENARPPSIVDVAEPVVAFNDGLVAVMRAGKSTPFPERYKTLAPLVERVFNLPVLAQSCVGPRWSSLSADEQSQLLSAFTAFTIASWVANFDTYQGERFDVVPKMRPVDSDEVVTVNVNSMSGETQRLDFVMRQDGSQWRAVDVLLDGTISQAAVQRSDFRRLISDNASALIASLRRKVQDLSGGTMHT